MGTAQQDRVLWRDTHQTTNYRDASGLKKLLCIYRGRKFLNDWGIERVKKKKLTFGLYLQTPVFRDVMLVKVL